MRTKVIGRTQIEKLRIGRGIGLTMMAKLIRIPTTRLADIESGIELMSEELKHRIAKIFAINIDYLDDKIIIINQGFDQLILINKESV